LVEIFLGKNCKFFGKDVQTTCPSMLLAKRDYKTSHKRKRRLAMKEDNV
jgi:hypothetical protein